MAEPAGRDGQIVTFYSFKGGTGRTMALANVAWILAANGHRVLVADWDLESPGLHRFFHPFMPGIDIRDQDGIIDMIRGYEGLASQSTVENLAEASARVELYSFSLDWQHFPEGGSLDFLSAGRQNHDYAATLSALDWDTFYDRLDGGRFFDLLRKDMKRRYDYVLIDSRTGLSDVADICTVHLPDVLVDCFTLSTQGIEGAAQVAQIVQETYAQRNIRILPVPMRVDQAEKERADAGQAFAARLFSGMPAQMSETERRAYWAAVEVPYRPFYAYEETLAVFGDIQGSPTSLLASFERITSYITKGRVTALPKLDEALRQVTRAKFTRRAPSALRDLVVTSAAENEVWADWIKAVLTKAGIRTLDAAPEERWPGEIEEQPRQLRVFSGGELEEEDPPDYAVYIAEARPLSRYSGKVAHAFLAGRSEEDAITELLRMLGIEELTGLDLGRFGVRFPGTEPKIFRVPARNYRFVGREDDLRNLRALLHSQGLPRPVAVQGLGGVGKTQLALEYVHRFASDYDLVWWLDAGQAAFVDASLGDLGGQMTRIYGPIAPAGANIEEIARLVLQTLARGRPVDRWLLVFDNADEIDAIVPFIPQGKGHVLITSRIRGWSERATALSMDVFAREESVAYLTARAGSITEEEADQVAEALGDLPLAVATSGAWLAETGISVADYIAELDTSTFAVSPLEDYAAPVARTWDLSLERLERQSKAAAHLFKLCSLLAPTINLDLLYNPAMANILSRLDPALADQMVIPRAVQEINKLALIKLDTSARQIHVHRLVQRVIRQRLGEQERERALVEIHSVLAGSRPRRDVDDPETWSRYRMLWPHLLPSEAMTSLDEQVRQLFIDRVRYLYLRGDLERGRDLALTVQQAWRRMRDADPTAPSALALPRQLLHLQFNLSNILRDLDEFEESRKLDETVLKGQRQLLGADHPHTLMTAGGLAGSLRALGKYREALEMDKVTHPAWLDIFGRDFPRTLIAANNLAVSYRLNGDFKSALELDENTYERRRSTIGPHEDLTLRSATHVCRDLLEVGQYSEAATRMDNIVETMVRELGPDSRTTLTSQILLGVALRSTGQALQARSHFETAIGGLTQRFGATSSETLAGRLSNSANMLALGDFSGGEAETRTVLDAYAARLGQDHPHTLVCQVNLASALRLLDRVDEGLALIRRTGEGLARTLGPEHPYTLAADMVHAVLLADAQQFGESLKLDRQTHDRLRKVLGEDHPDTLRNAANVQLTRIELAEDGGHEARENVIARLATVLGDRHPNIETLRGMRRLVRAVDPQPF